MVDDTPREVIQERFDRLVDLVAELAFKANQPFLGTTVEALVEGSSKRDPGVMVGHSPRNQTVHFPLPVGADPADYVGKMVDVKVEEARTWYLRGTPSGNPR